ncbi:MAG: hypothetical protein ACREN4_09425 [Candidatus Dormibacteria bacterium]
MKLTVTAFAVGLMVLVAAAVLGNALQPLKGAVCILALGGVCLLAGRA